MAVLRNRMTDKRTRKRRRRLLSSLVMFTMAFFMALVSRSDAASSSIANSGLFFTRPRYNASIYENNVGKSYVTADGERMGIQLPSVFFPSARNGQQPLPDIRYRIVAGDKNRLFKAESRLVGDFSFLLLRTRTGQVDVLNRERADLHKLRVRATLRSPVDGTDSDLLDAEADVWVHVLDTNDLSPMFYPSEYEANVPEDAPLHSSILAVKADDADVGINSQIYYSLAQSSDQFAVHRKLDLVTSNFTLISPTSR